MAVELYHALKQINRIRRKEIILPIARREVVVSPLSVGDDLILKTALISPVKLDKELMYLLWQHTEFWFPSNDIVKQPEQQPESKDGVQVPQQRGRKKKFKSQQDDDKTGGKYKSIPEQEFYNTISYFDKLVLIWGIYNVTYGTLGTQTIKCPHCEHEFESEVVVDDTLHEDSMELWDEEKPPFNKYTESLEIPLNDEFMLNFEVCIPSMSDFNRLLGLVPTSEIQNNLETIRSEFNTEQLMTLYTKKLSVYPKDKPEEKISSGATREILSSIKDCINIDAATEFFKQYAEKFNMYNINFYTKNECPNCGEEIKTPIDFEYQFFRKQLPS